MVSRATILKHTHIRLTTVSLTDDVHAARVNDSRRQQVKSVLLLANDHIVSRIASALTKFQLVLSIVFRTFIAKIKCVKMR